MITIIVSITENESHKNNKIKINIQFESWCNHYHCITENESGEC